MEYLCSEFNAILFITLRTQIHKYAVLNVGRLQEVDTTTWRDDEQPGKKHPLKGKERYFMQTLRSSSDRDPGAKKAFCFAESDGPKLLYILQSCESVTWLRLAIVFMISNCPVADKIKAVVVQSTIEDIQPVRPILRRLIVPFSFSHQRTRTI